jgi:hypothetical protein
MGDLANVQRVYKDSTEYARIDGELLVTVPLLPRKLTERLRLITAIRPRDRGTIASCNEALKRPAGLYSGDARAAGARTELALLEQRQIGSMGKPRAARALRTGAYEDQLLREKPQKLMYSHTGGRKCLSF